MQKYIWRFAVTQFLSDIVFGLFVWVRMLTFGLHLLFAPIPTHQIHPFSPISSALKVTVHNLKGIQASDRKLSSLVLLKWEWLWLHIIQNLF